MGTPSFSGGSTELVVTVGGVVWPQTGPTGTMNQGLSDTGAPITYEAQNPPTITSQTLGRWTLQIDLFDDTGTYAPARGQSIILTEGGYKFFAGCIQSVGRQRLMGTQNAIVYHVVATDKSGICDRRLVKTNTYLAGSSVAAAILDIVATCLNGEGITTTAASIPNLGNLTSDLVFNYSTVTDAFNQIATLSGTIWYVDWNGILWFNSFASLPAAPFDLWDNGTTTSENFRSLLIEETNIGYANSVYAVTNLSVVPGSGSSGGGTGVGSNTETYTATAGNVGVLLDALGDPYGITVTLPIGTLYSITVDGFAQTIVEYSQWNNQEPVPSTDDLGPWFWASGSPQVACSLPTGGSFPLAGATVVINYTPNTTSAAGAVGAALSPTDPVTGDPTGGCGSGIYELAVQVKNISDAGSLNAIAAAELAKLSGTPIFATYQTDKPGLAPGQIQNVNIPNLYVNNLNFVITSVQGIAVDGPLEFGSRFQWKVTAQTSQDLGNSVQWMATLLQNATNALPVPQYETASFVLAPGSSLAGGLVTTNPYPVKQTGFLNSIVVAFANPPVGQDLVIQFLDNGVLLPGSVTVPAGSAANMPFVYTYPAVNPTWVFNTASVPDIITIQATYIVRSTGTIGFAANGTAYLRWQI